MNEHDTETGAGCIGCMAVLSVVIAAAWTTMIVLKFMWVHS